MIIGLCGLKGSGKDTVAAYLVKQHGYERRAFADPLKKSVANLFGIPFSDVDKLKNEPHATVTLDFGHRRMNEDYAVSMTFRHFLQNYGTEAHRDVPEMGSDIWVDFTLPVRGYYENRNIVVSDVRFVNEADRITELGGKVVEVVRPGLVNDDPHSSEKIDFDTDYELTNNGTIASLYQAVEIMLEQVA
jgi:hypothetical protein